MSRSVLHPEQFDLLLTSEREIEAKRREDRAGIQQKGKGHPFVAETEGSKWCATCGRHGSVTGHR